MAQSLTINGLDLLQRQLADLPERVNVGMENGGERAAQVALNSKAREIGKTYSRAIPTNAQVYAASKQIKANKQVRIRGGKATIGQGGKPAWKRSGALADGQRIGRPSRFVREILTEGPAGLYEARLAALPTGALGINRSNPAAANARAIIEPQLKPIYETELNNALSRR